MTDAPPVTDPVAAACQALALTPGWARVQALHGGVDTETATAVIHEAARVAEGIVAPLNIPADRIGARLAGGRVLTPPGYPEAYARLGAEGWLAMDAPETLGGQGLPAILQTAAAPFFEAACPAFMMAAGSARSALHLLGSVPAPDSAALWGPKLASGAWAATICISEPDAGSDLGRIRSRAVPTDSGWRVTGQKLWISFGDHDMTPRIGHFLLARSNDRPGTRGLSLFLVANRRDDGTANGVSVSRIEEKMGLHGSPTCALTFEGAEAILLGAEGRGLPQLFAMIQRMRLLTGTQGLGIAQGALGVARAYAAERAQGGRPEAPPPVILRHADVRRQLAEMTARVEVLRAFTLELAAAMDLARLEPDAGWDAQAAAMLPLVKTFGAETGFDIAHQAIQVLGGAGYTRDWPVEQALRDARVLAIYEGTTGMQALDFLGRRLWRDGGAGIRALIARARDACAGSEAARATLAGFEALTARMAARADDPRAGEAGAEPYLRAAWAAMSAWMAVRLSGSPDPVIAAAARLHLASLPAELALHAARADRSPALIDAGYDD